MKLIIELEDDIAKGIRGENECEVEPREIVRSFQATIADAIANGTPYNPSGDLISREAVKAKMFDIPKPKEGATFWDGVDTVGNLIDNAPTVEQSIKVVCRSRNWSTDCTVTSGFEDGYRHGYRKAKEDIAKRIKEQYNEHHELIPYWLSIGDTKGGAE